MRNQWPKLAVFLLGMALAASAQAQCVKPISNPKQFTLNDGLKYRLVFLKSFDIPRMRDNWTSYDNEAAARNGAFLQPKKTVENGVAEMSPPFEMPPDSGCNLEIRSGDLSMNDLFKIDKACGALSKKGKFCGADVKFVSHVKKGESIDFTGQPTSEEHSGCSDHGVMKWASPSALLTSSYLLNLWAYEGYMNGSNWNLTPHWGNGIYQISCFVRDPGDCSRNVTAQTMLDAFPAGSIALYQIDDSVESCAAEAH